MTGRPRSLGCRRFHGPVRAARRVGVGRCSAGDGKGAQAGEAVQEQCRPGCMFGQVQQGRRPVRASRPAMENSRSHSRLGSQRRAGCSAKASICAQAVTSTARATRAHQIRFWFRSCRGRFRSPVSFATGMRSSARAQSHRDSPRLPGYSLHHQLFITSCNVFTAPAIVVSAMAFWQARSRGISRSEDR
jgi:hypothetical protein